MRPPATWLAVPALLASTAAGASDANLRIVATNVTAATGKLVVWIYASDDQWLREAGARTQKAVAIADNRQGDTVTVELLLPAGRYAAVVYHDVDGNGELARNFLGLPKEPNGISNNVRPRFGPPRFKNAMFEVGTGVTEQRIRLE